MLKATVSVNGCRVYSLSAGKSVPQFLEDAASWHSSLRYSEAYKRRVELVQEFEFSTASAKVKVSPDGNFIAAAGIYPPELKMYDTSELSIKFIRRFDSEIRDFLFLTEDYRKFVVLQSNRELEFHAQGGKHHSIRVPRHGRCMAYAQDTAVLYVGGSSSDIYRLDLEAGEFDAPLVSHCDYVNCCHYNPVMPILATGGSHGTIECWDVRNGGPDKPVGYMTTSKDDILYISSCCFSPDGLRLSVGSSEGDVKIFDIRTQKPLLTKSHRNSLPILSLEWITRSNSDTINQPFNDNSNEYSSNSFGSTDGNCSTEAVMSADQKSIKIWSPTTGDVFTTIESPADTLIPGQSSSGGGGGKQGGGWKGKGDNEGGGGGGKRKKGRMEGVGSLGVFAGACVYPKSGLIFAPGEVQRIGLYFVPSVGIAPRWCSHLDSLTEELEDPNSVVQTDGPDPTSLLGTSQPAGSVYDDFDFVTKSQLEQLGLAQVIGSSGVRAYMHGYLIRSDVYSKLKAVVEPFAYEEYRRERLRKKLEEKKPMRIQVKRKKPKVNAVLAEKLRRIVDDTQEKTTEAGGDFVLSKKEKKDTVRADRLLKDDRFNRIFTNPDYEITEDLQ
eukprot:GHVQ01029013.1.p1 GENE.GHVQ01029013.1~~GHVQ01029013.1.p1  ORF type:complete len:610 (-),score=114.75 GHVQ01029013.1:201-2030(-)